MYNKKRQRQFPDKASEANIELFSLFSNFFNLKARIANIFIAKMQSYVEHVSSFCSLSISISNLTLKN